MPVVAFAAIFFCAVGKVVRAHGLVCWQHDLDNEDSDHDYSFNTSLVISMHPPNTIAILTCFICSPISVTTCLQWEYVAVNSG